MAVAARRTALLGEDTLLSALALGELPRALGSRERVEARRLIDRPRTDRLVTGTASETGIANALHAEAARLDFDTDGCDIPRGCETTQERVALAHHMHGRRRRGRG